MKTAIICLLPRRRGTGAGEAARSVCTHCITERRVIAGRLHKLVPPSDRGLGEELRLYLLLGNAKMFCNISNDGIQGPDLEGFVAWDGQVMLAFARGGQTDVATGLTCDLLAEP